MNQPPSGRTTQQTSPTPDVETLRGFFEVCLDLLCVADLKGNLLLLNSEWENVLGYSLAEITSKPFLNFVHPEDVAATRSALELLLQNEFLSQFENRYISKDGSLRRLLWRARRHGELIYAAARDVTELRRSVQNMERITELFEKAGEVARIGGWEVNLKTGEVWWSEVTRQILGVRPDFSPSPEAGIAFFPEGEDREIIQRAFENATQRGIPYDVESRIIRADGQLRWVRSVGYPVMEEGQIVRVAGTFQDITDRKEIEHAMRDAAERAEEANRAKSAFLATMSHEIRTPLNGVIGATELLRTTRLTEEQETYTSMILQSGELLLSLINDILDYSKIESGRIEIEHVPFDLVTTIEGLLDPLAPQAGLKEIEIVFFPHPALPTKVVGDAVRLRQVLLNLAGNAVKFTERGHVVIRAAPAAEGHIHFEVEDTGIGIPPGRIGEIFLPFVQGESSTNRNFGGSGLGLSISHRLVSLMGGELDVRSELGVGTCFSFDLPLPTAPDAGAPLIGKQRLCLKGHRIVVLERSAVLADLLRQSFAACEAEVYVFASRKEFLAAEIPANRVDLAIADASLFDPVPLLHEIRARCGPNIPILLLSSDPRSLAPGLCHGVLSKPLKIGRLLAEACRILREQPPVVGILAKAAPAVPGTNATQENSFRILIVEDNRLNQVIARTMLGHLGITNVRIANNGEEALKAIEEFSPHLVLMDCQMPRMDGYQATRILREKEAASSPQHHLPIVGLSAAAVTGDREKALRCGMDAYLTKPLRPPELRAALLDLLPGFSAQISRANPETSA